MHRTFTYQLEPNSLQSEALDSLLEQCRQLYNAALQQRIEAYHRQNISLTLYDQKKQLTELRQSDPEWKVGSCSLQVSALYRLDLAYKAFFRRVKAGHKPGFPRFKSKDRYSTFETTYSANDLRGDHFKVPNIGLVKVRLYRPLKGRPLNYKVTKGARGWRISITCDLGAAPAARPIHKTTGVDVGLTHFATLNDGTQFANPRFYRVSEAELARAQQSLSRKKRGSKSRQRAKLAVRRVCERTANRRLNFARHLAKELVVKFDGIAVEDLNVKGMASGWLSKSINDAAWSMFLHCLKNKAEEAGSTVVAVNPRGTSQECAACGAACVPKTLADRWHFCLDCGFSMDRDQNAAWNVLLRAGFALVPVAEVI